jgi:hypothetical protein
VAKLVSTEHAFKTRTTRESPILTRLSRPQIRAELRTAEAGGALLFGHLDLEGKVEISQISFDGLALAGDGLVEVSPIPLLQSSIRGNKGATGLDFPLVTKRVGA